MYLNGKKYRVTVKESWGEDGIPNNADVDIVLTDDPLTVGKCEKCRLYRGRDYDISLVDFLTLSRTQFLPVVTRVFPTLTSVQLNLVGATAETLIFSFLSRMIKFWMCIMKLVVAKLVKYE
jgi:hypothetical protein